VREHDDPIAALAAYEKQRLEAATQVVLIKRCNPPDAILREVFQRTRDRPFDAIENVISRDELLRCPKAISGSPAIRSMRYVVEATERWKRKIVTLFLLFPAPPEASLRPSTTPGG